MSIIAAFLIEESDTARPGSHDLSLNPPAVLHLVFIAVFAVGN
jgi:hypothetical protein